MNNNLVSIIIPAFNVGEYIDECLDSIEKQTYGNIEIIIIDDGSTDSTLYKIKEKAKKTHHSYHIIEQTNSGQSVARNRGIKEAKGKYIVFVDSDDWLTDNQVIEKMFNKIESEDADFVQCSLEFVKGEKHSSYYISDKEPLFGEQILIDMLLVKDLYTSPCAKIYSSEFIKNNNLSFIEGLVNEDTGFSILIALNAKKVAFLSDIVYSSREREGSTSRSSFVRMFKTMHEVLSMTLQELSKSSRFNNKILNLFEGRYIRSMLYNLLQTAQRNNYKRFRDDYEYCVKNTEYSAKLKYKNFLPFKHRMLASLSTYRLIFFVFAKSLRFLGYSMH